MEMIRVSSSAINSVGYDLATNRMRIAFQQGHSYNYCGVPQSIYEAFMRSFSKGTYYNSHIKDRYQC